MIYDLDEECLPGFPDPRHGEPGGLFAVGADISPERMRTAYSWGILPWYPWRYEKPVWYCPMERFVIFPEEIHISHSMRTLLNKNRYRFSVNMDFEGVVRGCSEGGRGEHRMEHECSWLGEEMIKTALSLYRSGDAASVEVWDEDGNLVGGLYGIIAGHIFCGESMFSRVPSGSKLALIALAKYIDREDCPWGIITLIDCQFETPHLKSMGGRSISYKEYLSHNGQKLPPLSKSTYYNPAILA